MHDGRLSTDMTLSYSSNFINGDHKRLDNPTREPAMGRFIDTALGPWAVVPKYHESLETYEKEHWQGRCCKACGRLNSKYVWSSLTFPD
jgi:hypothetical protein